MWHKVDRKHPERSYPKVNHKIHCVVLTWSAPSYYQAPDHEQVIKVLGEFADIDDRYITALFDPKQQKFFSIQPELVLSPDAPAKGYLLPRDVTDDVLAWQALPAPDWFDQRFEYGDM